MDLPPALRSAVDQLLEGVTLPVLREAAGTLSRRYRGEVRDGRLHISGDLAAKAYLATRLPATYAAVRASLAATAEALPGLAPKSLLDIGAGPGTALFAAADCFDSLEAATLVETSEAARRIGKQLADAAASPVRAEWIAADLATGLSAVAPADLVTLAYVLDELSPSAIEPLVDRLWALTQDTLLVVEPGTPAGWRRILAVRARLIDAGAHLAAPCPHSAACPLAAPDWCHFSRRVARSRLHRLAKSGDVPWEDEKFIYVAASRTPAETLAARVLAPPQTASGTVRLKLCQADGTAAEKLVTRREGATFKAARRADWGDAVEIS